MSELGRWLFVAGDQPDESRPLPQREIEIINRAMAAAPAEVLTNEGDLLPRRRPEIAACRICGASDDLSREHIPPRSAGNSDRHRSHTLMDWLERESLDEIPNGQVLQNGTFGFVLCRDCNSLTGREYAPEYATWASTCARMLMDWGPDVDAVDRRLILPMLRVEFQRRPFARFARQVLSMLVCLAGPWDVAGRHPEVRATLLSGTPTQLPTMMSMSMALCMPVAARWCGPSLIVDRDAGTWRWVVSLAFPPFAFELTLAESGPASDEARPFCDISGFLNHADTATAEIELDLPVAFAHTVFPTDWRNRAQIEGGLDIYGRAREY